MIVALFAATGAEPLLNGRDIEWSDDDAAPPVVLVNVAFAKRFFDGADPIGRRIRVHRPNAEPGAWTTIVGLVPNVGIRTQAEESEDAIYFPLTQRAQRGLAILLTGIAAALLPARRAAAIEPATALQDE